MSLFDSYSRDQLRRTYTEAWQKHRQRLPLSPLEALIADVLELHPRYQRVVESLDDALALEAAADGATENPFLHMGLHLAVREQVAVDRPPGVRALLLALQNASGDVHAAEHVLMEALGETLWEAQRSGRTPDEQHYLALARRALER
ncbi:MAG: DUF1841 family protein [Steroidobacteraceae bacterium]|jgi:hypothetical protein